MIDDDIINYYQECLSRYTVDGAIPEFEARKLARKDAVEIQVKNGIQRQDAVYKMYELRKRLNEGLTEFYL